MNLDIFSSDEDKQLAQWRQQIAGANEYNIFCHCRDCEQEWVTSDEQAPCLCGSRNIQRIPCWQFPDD